jgi:kinesin family protein 3/17
MVSFSNGYITGTIFAYGQTGCGKTHTMVGYGGNEESKGIIPRTFLHIFGCIGDSDT